MGLGLGFIKNYPAHFILLAKSNQQKKGRKTEADSYEKSLPTIHLGQYRQIPVEEMTLPWGMFPQWLAAEGRDRR